MCFCRDKKVQIITNKVQIITKMLRLLKLTPRKKTGVKNRYFTGLVFDLY